MKKEIYELFLSQDSKEAWRLIQEHNALVVITSVETQKEDASVLYNVPNQDPLPNPPEPCPDNFTFFTNEIVKKAIEAHVDIIGLSGLITPSLEEMVNVAKELQRAGLDIPIMIGGATTSELHVALKIAPVYSGPVVWMKDASQNALVAARLKSNQNQMEQELSEKYEHLREDYQQQQTELLSYEEAKKQKKNLFE